MINTNPNYSNNRLSKTPIKNVITGLIVILIFLIGHSLFAQVGVGNTNPQAQLDISASSTSSPTNLDGILIPRMSSLPAVASMTINQDGMLVFYTGTGNSGKGFYYWDNSSTTWNYLASGSKNTLDEAYDEGGSGAGRTILTDSGPLRLQGSSGLESFATSNTSLRGIYNDVEATGTNNSAIGIDNIIDSEGGVNGVRNLFYSSSGNSTGFYNEFRDYNLAPGNVLFGLHNNHLSGDFSFGYGVKNSMAPAFTIDGNYSAFSAELRSSGTGTRKGLEVIMNGNALGSKYGVDIDIASNLPGPHRGLNVDVQSTTGYAAYLIGRISLGTGTSSRYLMPETSGSINQVMAMTSGSQVGFVDATSLVGTNNTLDQAYDQGGAGAGRIINVTDGAIEFNSLNWPSSGRQTRFIGGNSTESFVTEINSIKTNPADFTDLIGMKSSVSGINGEVIAVDARIGISASSVGITNNYGVKSEVIDNDSGSTTNNYGLYSNVSGGDSNYGILSFTDTGSSNWAGYFGDPSATGASLTGNVYVKDVLEVNRGLIYRPSGAATNVGDILQYSDTNGSLESVDPSTLFTDTNTQNTLDEAYNQGGAGTGRIINATDGALRIDGTDGILITGTFGSGADVEVNSAGTRMFFNPREGSFRAGTVSGNQWAPFNNGNYSVAFGENTIASGNYAIAMGESSIASDVYAISLGDENEASSDHAIALGRENIASGNSSVAIGWNNTASGQGSTVLGAFNAAPAYYETTLGVYATTYTASGTVNNASDRLFSIGNGTSNSTRSNALTIFKNGRMNINDAYNMPVTDGSTGQVLTTDGSGNVTFQTPTNGDINQVNAGNGLTGGGATGNVTVNAVGVNGITTNANDFRLGGNLIQATAITQGANNFDINLNNTGDFAIQDNGTDVFFVEDSGDVGFGTNNPAYQLHVLENTTTETRAVNIDKDDNTSDETYGIYNSKTSNGTGYSYAIYNLVNGSGTGQKYGAFNRINTTSNGNQYAVRNWLSAGTSSTQFGVYNNLINNGTGNRYGTYNAMRGSQSNQQRGVHNEFDTSVSATELTGVRNQLYQGSASSGVQGIYNDIQNASNSSIYGVRTIFQGVATGTGNKYGTYNEFSNSAGGTHYGTYNSVATSNGWAGYFLGRVYIGTNTTNGYDLPTDNGSANQVLVTNGAGGTSWGASVSANNGVSLSGGANNVQWGGTLTQDTNINFGNFSTRFNMNGTGNLIIQDNGSGVVQVDNAGNTTLSRTTTWRQTNIVGTQVAQLTADGNDGRFSLNENGGESIILDANGQTVFNEQGFDRDFRIESDDDTNMLRLDANNNRIGVRTATPDATLDIEVNSTSSVAHIELSEANDDDDGARIKFNNTIETDNYWTLYGRADNTEANARFNLYYSSIAGGGGGNIMVATGNGDIGIGTVPAYRLDSRDNVAAGYVTNIRNNNTGSDADGLRIQLNRSSLGTANVFIGFVDDAGGFHGRITGNGAGTGTVYNTTSDQRLKTNISDIDGALQIIEKIQPRLYEYKANLGIQEYGFIAQELQPVYPQAVSGSPDSDVTKDPMMVDYGRLTPILAAGLKELKNEVNTLKAENKALKEQLNKMAQLEARLSAIEHNISKGTTTNHVSHTTDDK